MRDKRPEQNRYKSSPSVEQAKELQSKRPEPPKETSELETSIRARHAAEAQAIIERQNVEKQYLREAADLEIREKLEPFDALQKAALARYDREHAKPEGIARWIEAAKAWLDPEKAAEETRQREEQREAFVAEQEKQREMKVTALDTAKQADLTELFERHEQQRREHAARLDGELQRHARDHAAAERLLAEIEERRRLEEERRKERERTRDGPEPPKLTR